MSAIKSNTTPEISTISATQAHEGFNVQSNTSTLSNRFREHRKHLVLRIVVIILSIIGIVGFTVCSVITQTPFYVYNDQGYTGWVVLGPIAYTLILSIIYLFLMLFLKKGPPHPGFGVGLDLLSWVTTFCVLIIVWCLSGTSSDDYGCYNVSEARCDHLARLYFGWLLAAEITTAINIFVVLVIWVIECIETDRLRKEKKAKRRGNGKSYVPLS